MNKANNPCENIQLNWSYGYEVTHIFRRVTKGSYFIEGGVFLDANNQPMVSWAITSKITGKTFTYFIGMGWAGGTDIETFHKVIGNMLINAIAWSHNTTTKELKLHLAAFLKIANIGEINGTNS